MQTKREPAAERPVTPLLFPAKEASIISGGSSLPLRTFQLSVRAAPLSAGRLRLLCSVVTVPPVRAAFRLFACRSCLFPGCTGIFCATRIDSSEPGLAPSRFVSMPSCSVYRRVSGRRNRIPSRCDHNAWRVCRRCEPTTSKRRNARWQLASDGTVVGVASEHEARYPLWEVGLDQSAWKNRGAPGRIRTCDLLIRRKGFGFPSPPAAS